MTFVLLRHKKPEQKKPVGLDDTIMILREQRELKPRRIPTKRHRQGLFNDLFDQYYWEL